jgi:hypothetical protein
MRTIVAIVLFVAASISAASAQTPAPTSAQTPAPKIPFSMDHGRSADAAAAAQAAAAANAAKAAAAAAATASSPSQSASFSINGGNVIPAAPSLTQEQQKAEEEGRVTWQARCRPAVVVDRDGMRRTKYAAPDCDLSRFNTAGK